VNTVLRGGAREPAAHLKDLALWKYFEMSVGWNSPEELKDAHARASAPLPAAGRTPWL